MPQITERLMAQGKWSCEFERDPEVEDELLKHRHLTFLWEGKRRYTGVILQRILLPDRIIVEGRGLQWWLGSAEYGPLVEFARYCAGNDLLTNGDFDNGENFWRAPEDTTWTLGGGTAATLGDYAADDVLSSAERIESFAGDVVRLRATAGHSGSGTGRLRIYLVESGRFVHPQLVTDPSFDDPSAWTPGSAMAPDVSVSGGAARIGPFFPPNTAPDPSFEGTTDWVFSGGQTENFTDPAEARSGNAALFVGPFKRPNGLVNPGFETGTLANWQDGIAPSGVSASTTRAHGGTWSARFDESAGGAGLILRQEIGAAFTAGTLRAGNRHRIRFYVYPDGVTSSTRFEAFIDSNSSGETIIIRFDGTGLANSNWNQVEMDVDLPDDWDAGASFDPSFNIQVVALDGAASGDWYFDSFKIERVDGFTQHARGASGIDVVPGARYRYSFWVRTTGGYEAGRIKPRVRTRTQGDPSTQEFHEGSGVTKTDGEWQQTDYTFRMPPDHDRALLYVAGQDVFGDTIYVDDIEFVQETGNIGSIDSDSFFEVIPERTYRLEATVRSAPNHASGDIFMRMLCRRDEGDATGQEILDSPRMSNTDGEAAKLDWTFRTSSGLRKVQPSVVGQDVYGDAITVESLEIVDDDVGSRVSALVIDPAASATYTKDVTLPAGSESFRVEARAETDGGGWSVTEIQALRVCTPDTAQAIVADMLISRGSRLLYEGAIEAAGAIAFDAVYRNVSNLQVLQELSRSGLVSPQREWRINPDGTFDWDRATNLFVDRTGFVIVDGDVWLRQDPQVADDGERFVDRVKLIGAELRGFRGDRLIVTGEATNPIGGRKTFAGDPFVRTHLVEDSGAGFAAYANALAATAAADDAGPRDLLDIGLNDWVTLGFFEVGDWIYVHLPEHGVEDLANQVEHRHGIAHPKKLRVISRTWTLGPGEFGAIIQREDGTETDQSDRVLWSSDTAASVQVGDPRPDFVVNPQAGGVGRQYMRFRGKLREN